MTLGDFSAQADAYARTRPSYPADLLSLLVAEAGLSAGDPVVDLGAGTGIFTELLVERGFRVTALEPNSAMRAQSKLARVVWVDGTFERTNVADCSQRWAVAAQAFHWADPQQSLPEIRRILQPGCPFTILWNNRISNESELLGFTEAAIRQHVPGFDEAYRQRDWRSILESTGDFTFVSHHEVTHVISMSKERYLDLWKSHNRLNTLAGPERFNAILAELRRHLDDASLDEVPVPYRCEAWSARRKN